MRIAEYENEIYWIHACRFESDENFQNCKGLISSVSIEQQML